MKVGKTFKKVKFDSISVNKTVLPKEGTFNGDSVLHCETCSSGSRLELDDF